MDTPLIVNLKHTWRVSFAKNDEAIQNKSQLFNNKLKITFGCNSPKAYSKTYDIAKIYSKAYSW